MKVTRITWTPYFYPRPPRGGRHGILFVMTTSGVFLSTPSARRATHHIIIDQRVFPISIHALREEGDMLLGIA